MHTVSKCSIVPQRKAINNEEITVPLIEASVTTYLEISTTEDDGYVNIHLKSENHD